MSRQYEDPNYHSSSYQTSYPYPTSSQQSVQFTQPPPNTRDTYSDPSRQHALSSSYQESSLQPQPSRQRHSSRSPYAGTVPFPEPHGSSAGHPQTYYPPSQTTQNLTVGTHQQERQGLYGYPPPTGSSSDTQRFYAEGGSDTGRGSSVYSHPGGGYTGTAAQGQDWNAAGYDATGYDREHDPLPKAPGGPPASGHRLPCRFPHCNRPPFFDRRVNEFREWCSDQHMQAAIMQRVEKPCKNCQRWPRRNGYKLCSGHYCRYPGQY